MQTEAEKIWDEIKDVAVEMFSLSGQTVKNFSKPIAVEPTRLFLLFSSGAFLPALEVAIGKKYHVEQQDKYILVTRK